MLGTSRMASDDVVAFAHAVPCVHLLLQRHQSSAASEADFQNFFGVTPPTVHRMVIELERRGLIRRTPRQARSIELCVAAEDIPRLLPQPFHSSVSRY